MANPTRAVTEGVKMAASAKFFTAAVLVFLATLAYLNSQLPGAAQARKLIGMTRTA